MKQLDDLAANGQSHHYKIDTALFLMQFHASASDDQRVRIQALRDQIGQKPPKKESAQVAQDALALLNELRESIVGPNYSAIFGQLQSGLNDTQ